MNDDIKGGTKRGSNRRWLLLAMCNRLSAGWTPEAADSGATTDDRGSAGSRKGCAGQRMVKVSWSRERGC